jgi:acyl dehydratase
MALNLEAIGHTSSELTHTYTWKDVVLYALGIGATRDELDFLYERRGPKVFPTYTVIPGFAAHGALFDTIGGQLQGLVHASQTIRLHKPLPASGTLRTVAKVKGIYDLKRMAESQVTTETRDADGELLAETEWSILYRLDGGFGGEAPPKRERVKTPERAPDFSVRQTIGPEQAILYRLSGDLNPLHIDADFAKAAGFDAPILHGLCTYGYVGRAVLKAVAPGQPERLKVLSGQFRRPVWPGETLVTEGWNEGNRILLRAGTEERPGDHVFTNAYAELG